MRYLFSVFVDADADVKNNAELRRCGCRYPFMMLIS